VQRKPSSKKKRLKKKKKKLLHLNTTANQSPADS